MLLFINKIINKWLRFYRKRCFEKYIGQKCKGLTILGKIYCFSKNIHIGENVTFFPGVMFQGGGDIYIGDNTFIENDTIIYSEKGYKVQIGKDVMIAGQCYIINTDHKFDGEDLMNKQGTVSGDIIIDDNVWIAGNVSILKNVHIKSGCVIGAKSLVNKSTENDGVYVGIPARLLRYRKKE